MKPDAKYVVYDPPVPGCPYIAVLLRPDMPPRAFLFQTFEEATEFLTAQARPATSPHGRRPGGYGLDGQEPRTRPYRGTLP